MAVITPVRVQPGFKGLVTLAELIGEPLEAHQKRIARTWLESEAREVVTIAPKGNHKTTTVALAGLPDVEFRPRQPAHPAPPCPTCAESRPALVPVGGAARARGAPRKPPPGLLPGAAAGYCRARWTTRLSRPTRRSRSPAPTW